MHDACTANNPGRSNIQDKTVNQKGSTLDGEIRDRPFMYSVLETASSPLVWEPIQYDGDWRVAWELNEWSTPNSFRIGMIP